MIEKREQTCNDIVVLEIYKVINVLTFFQNILIHVYRKNVYKGRTCGKIEMRQLSTSDRIKYDKSNMQKLSHYRLPTWDMHIQNVAGLNQFTGRKNNKNQL